MNGHEIEIKYYVTSLSEIRKRAVELGAELIQPRTHELNMRFDTPNHDLRSVAKVLRLRRDTENRLTYKGPAVIQDGVRIRPEYEFTLSDFHAARALLEALGYQVDMIYEKFRTVYDLEGVHITLDEMPYGDFVELEGPDRETIQSVNRQLGLIWERSAPDSYTMIFDRLCAEKQLPFRNLVFENFQDLQITPADLHLQPADQDG